MKNTVKIKATDQVQTTYSMQTVQTTSSTTRSVSNVYNHLFSSLTNESPHLLPKLQPHTSSQAPCNRSSRCRTSPCRATLPHRACARLSDRKHPGIHDCGAPFFLILSAPSSSSRRQAPSPCTCRLAWLRPCRHPRCSSTGHFGLPTPHNWSRSRRIHTNKINFQRYCEYTTLISISHLLLKSCADCS